MGAGGDEGDGIGGASASALETRLLEVPGIVSTALLSSLPGGRASTRTFVVEPSQPRVREIRLDVSAFDATQFDREMLVPIAGRGFGGRDDASSCRVALVNETAATRYFDGQAVGQAIYESDGTTVETIGVLGSCDTDARDTPTACRAAVVSELTTRTWFGSVAVGGALIDPDGVRVAVVGVVEARPLAVAQPAPRPLAFVPHRQAYQPVMAITATTIEESPRLRRSVDEAVQTVEGVLGLADAISLEEHLIRTSLAAERIAISLVSVCAAMALVIAVVGVHGAMNDLVAVGLAGLVIGLLVIIACAVPAWRAVAVEPREAMQQSVYRRGGWLSPRIHSSRPE